MALDPNIALNVRPLELPNQLAQYGQLAQLQNYETQNQLHQMQMREAEATAQERNALRQLNPNSPDYEQQLFKLNPQLGIQYRKEATASEASKAQALSSRINAAQKKQEMLGQAWRDISSRPSDANITAHLEDILTSPMYDDSEKASIQTRADQLLQMPFEERQRTLAQIGAKPGDLRPHMVTENLGGVSRISAVPAFGGPAAVVSEAKKTATIADTLARQKFEWEKANPGYELKETEDGNIVGVNKRTLQAVPVTMGGAAPAAALGMPGMGMPGVGMPGARTPAPTTTIPAISGMTSVLDQRVPAQPIGASMVGMPLKGKGTALTESQGNATAYGLRMLDAQKLLNDLEKQGTVSGGRIKGTVEGALKAVVPYQGEKLAEGVGNLMNVLPGIAGGPSEDQQSYQQAKTNFITAVLRKESGAAIAPSEFETEDRKYFPQAGDTDKVIKQKQKSRDLAIEAMKIQAGPGAKNIKAYKPGVLGSNENDPLGLGIGGR